MFAAAGLLPFALHRGGLRLARLRPVGWLAAAVACFSLMMVTFISSVGQTTSANAIILMYTAPLWVLLAAPLVTGDRAHRRELYAAAIAMTGMAVIIGGTLLAPGSNTEVSGVMMGLAAGLCFAGVSLALRHLRTADPIAVICVNNIFTAIVLLAAAGIAGDVSIRGWPILLLVALGLFQIAAPYVIYCHALQHMTPHLTSELGHPVSRSGRRAAAVRHPFEGEPGEPRGRRAA